jgi:oxygen-independent coproporphyrinogen-3 oxidase
MHQEIHASQKWFPHDKIETIYFGGGTPSLLSSEEINALIQSIKNHYHVSDLAEITLEMNPEDAEETFLSDLKSMGINRLSLGVQSMSESLLTFSNRNHQASQSILAYDRARIAGFDNISIDLMFGFPNQSEEEWMNDVAFWVAQKPEHLSFYSLTVEERTALKKMVKTGQTTMPSDERVARFFMKGSDYLTMNGYEHYEVSNFAQPGYRSQHNGNYWKGISYLGIGPSAHGFDDNKRRWNIRNNVQYAKLWKQQIPSWEEEILSEEERFNELLMIRLRTAEGLKWEEIPALFTQKLKENIQQLDPTYFLIDEKSIRMTRMGWLLLDHILVELFEAH